MDQLDLVLLIHEDNHLIDDHIIKTYGLKIIKVKTDNPRMIPFAAQKVMGDSFVSPLESGATLGILKTFSIFKSTVPNLGYFEIENLDKKFSNMKLDVLLT